MMREFEKLEEGNYYHIYNRGINCENIFQSPDDYLRFITLFKNYSKDVMDVFAYSLLKNHFHSLIYLKKDVLVERNDGKGFIRLLASKQLGHMFNSYAQTFNFNHQRTGSLFESPFKRKVVELNHHLTSVILYIHNNAKHHGFVNDFREWPYTSYHELVGNQPTFLNTDFVIDLFEGKENFIQSHVEYSALKGLEKWLIE